MTKTVRGKVPGSLLLYKLGSLFRLHFTQERNIQHQKRKWRINRYLEVETKCEVETITAAELLASKFLSLIRK